MRGGLGIFLLITTMSWKYSLLKGQLILVRILANVDGISLLESAAQEKLADTILDIGLDGTLQWTGTKLHIVALGGNKLLRLVSNLDVVAHLVDTVEESLQFDVDNLLPDFDYASPILHLMVK